MKNSSFPSILSKVILWPSKRDVKFSDHRMSAHERVKKNVKGPRFSNFAYNSSLAFFQYLGVFLILSRTMYGSSSEYTQVPSGFTLSSPLWKDKFILRCICFSSVWAAAMKVYGGQFPHLLSTLRILCSQ